MIPLTARLEFDRHQEEMASEERQRLAAAYLKLDQHSITYTRVEPDTHITTPDLISLIRALRTAVSEIEPTKEVFDEAHRRAALHERPHPPGKKSDEMRDLVIWIQALQIARESGGALLVSADEVHVHERGDDEANAVGLVRVKSVAEALEYLEVLTPAGRTIRSLLGSVWANFASSEPSLPDGLVLLSVRDTLFVQGEEGLASARGWIRIRADEGRALEAGAVIELQDGRISKASLKTPRLNGDELNDIDISPDTPWEQGRRDVESMLIRLRRVLGS